jgi:hypothetical protein
LEEGEIRITEQKTNSKQTEIGTNNNELEQNINSNSINSNSNRNNGSMSILRCSSTGHSFGVTRRTRFSTAVSKSEIGNIPSMMEQIQIELYPFEEYDIRQLNYNPKTRQTQTQTQVTQKSKKFVENGASAPASNMNMNLDMEQSFACLRMDFDFERGTTQQGLFFEVEPQLEPFEKVDPQIYATNTLIIDEQELDTQQYIDPELYCIQKLETNSNSNSNNNKHKH